MPVNRLLAALPAAEYTRLTRRMTPVTFGHKQLVYRPGGAYDHVYFPQSGLISSVVVMKDGSSAEAAATGHEGMLGMPVFLGAVSCFENVYCQVAPSECLRWSAGEFRDEVAKGGPLEEIIHAYARSAMNVNSQMTACNSLHSVDKRCARWLLMCRDAVAAESFPLTQEFLSVMLGVRRATVTVAASRLQNAGIIAYRHGQITVLDPVKLEEESCECYGVIRKAYDVKSPT